jgi:HAD superfamily hydrolase (TIGR01509 family)
MSSRSGAGSPDPASVSLVHPFRLVAFDMDGVLVDSFQCWWMLLNDTLASRGDRPLTREEFQSTWGQDVEADRRRFFPDWSLERLTRHYEERVPEYLKHVEAEPDSAAVLDRLRREGKLVAVATNSPVRIATTLLEEACLAHRLDRIVGVDLVEQGKPEPDLLLHIAEELSVPLSETCYVGDSEFDAGAARAAGIHFIGYRREGDARIERLAELVNR